MWSLTFACPPNVADLNLAYVHPTPWSFWSSIMLASIVHLSFLLIASPPTSSQPANRCVLLSIAGGLIAPIPTSMSGWWVSEWATLLLHLPHLRRSGGRDTDPAVAGKAAFIFFLQGGWCVIWEHRGEDMAAATADDMSVTGRAATPWRGPGTRDSVRWSIYF